MLVSCLLSLDEKRRGLKELSVSEVIMSGVLGWLFCRRCCHLILRLRLNLQYSVYGLRKAKLLLAILGIWLLCHAPALLVVLLVTCFWVNCQGVAASN